MTTRLSELTTTRVGGPALELHAPEDRAALVAVARELFAEHDEVVVLGGGSNTIAGDGEVETPVLHVRTRGRELVQDREDEVGTVLVRAEAGEPWPELVGWCVAQGWAGVEALSGIPGSAGAAPVQNIGAYGQEVSGALRRIEFLDARSGEVSWLPAERLGFGYRSSALKRGELRGLVLRIELELLDAGDGLSAPIVFPQLAAALGCEPGERLPLARVREEVLRLRASKGMVLDPDDPDSVSSGSFFMNPVVSRGFALELPADAPRFQAPPAEDGTEQTKLSAAWLIERAGVPRGFALPGSRAAISAKHTLAITNRGGASAEQVLELARYVRARVESEFGVRLFPEPVLLGAEL